MSLPLKQSPWHPEVSPQLWQSPSHSRTARDVQPVTYSLVSGSARNVITVFRLLHPQ